MNILPFEGEVPGRAEGLENNEKRKTGLLICFLIGEIFSHVVTEHCSGH